MSVHRRHHHHHEGFYTLPFPDRLGVAHNSDIDINVMLLKNLFSVIMLLFIFVSQLKYTKAGKENFKNYGVVLDTPVYVTALQSSINASDVSHYSYSCFQVPSFSFFFFVWFTPII